MHLCILHLAVVGVDSYSDCYARNTFCSCTSVAHISRREAAVPDSTAGRTSKHISKTVMLFSNR